MTTDTSLEVRDMGVACQEFEFEVIARNEAGNSSGVTITESIPISESHTGCDMPVYLVTHVLHSIPHSLGQGTTFILCNY